MIDREMIVRKVCIMRLKWEKPEMERFRRFRALKGRPG